ncbi:MAG TPA: RIP metalloprotease RseP [Burkholderiales bacterium]|jgi:regulator of sigma E protease|nr:RIP metalloprotease RseP [Burkholderiales bacterium]
MNLLHTVLSFIVALGVLIVVHELGHYLVARWCGVKVLRFSVGFGKPLFMRRLGRDQTEWAVAVIPLGGYVKMVDEREGEVAPADLPRAFNRQNVGKRFAIVAAGPIANFLLAIAVYWGLFLNGVQDMKPVLGTPDTDTPAARAGVQSGDVVSAVNGEAITSWQDVRWHVLQHAIDREPIQLEIRDHRDMRQTRSLEAVPGIADEPEGDILGRLGLHAPDVPVLLGEILPDTPAERAGLLNGDRILAVDGEPVTGPQQLVKRIVVAAGKTLKFSVERTGVLREIDVTPQDAGGERAGQGRIGAAVRGDTEALAQYRYIAHYGFFESLNKALARTWDMSIFALKSMGKMLIGELSWRNLSGPVTIADYAGQSAQLGWSSYIAFIALISISLGVLNLMPIPLLDGGHLMYYTIEFLKGSPVSERIMEFGQRAGLAVLLALMVFAFYNDINRLLG